MIRIDNIDTYDSVRPFSMTRYYERLCEKYDRNPKSIVLWYINIFWFVCVHNNMFYTIIIADFECTIFKI